MSHLYNNFKELVAKGEIDLATDTIKAILLGTNTTAGSENDGIEFVGDLATLDEFDGANYARKTLANQTVSEDGVNDRVVFDADDLTYSALGAGTRSIAGVLLYKFGTNDADSPLIAWIEFSPVVTPDGHDELIQWSSDDGILYME